MRETSQPKSRQPLSETLSEARTGLFRATLLFGSIAAALALIVVPAADRQAKLSVAERAGDVDPIITGATSGSGAQRYVVRRSVIEDTTGPCLLFPNGTQRGAC